MYKPPFTPFYARATAASKAKRSSKWRPPCRSTFRETNPNTVTILPADPQKTCPLAMLPAEIRLLIYNYVLPQGPVHIDANPEGVPEQTHDRWPAIIRVSRLIRREAAHEFYIKTSFEAYICSFGARSPNWITCVSKTDLDSLAQNRNMTMLLPSYMNSSHFCPWDRSKNFGNIYNVGPKRCQDHFLTFCTIATWWLQCGQHSMRNIDWKFKFGRPDNPYDFFYLLNHPNANHWTWLFEHMSTIALPCVQRNWVRSTDKKSMKKPALGMLEALDREFKQNHAIAKQKALLSWALRPDQRAERELYENRKEDEWNTRVQLLRRHLQKW